MTEGRENRDTLVTSVVLGVLVLCCAAPALIAAGVLGAVGAVLANPAVIGAGVLVAALTVVWAVRRGRSPTDDD
jgi:hypothetical protein